tara:strand:- start:22 stop:759 length:738 start_codon:yes stop_codon:yes gene_type:complete
MLLITKKSSTFSINFGQDKFLFEFTDKGAHKGGRGLYIFRDKIEKLLSYGNKFVNEGDVCIDGGANIGIYTLAFLSAVGNKGKVIAIEPMNYAANEIRRLSSINNFKDPIVIEGALSNEAGSASLDFSDGVGFGSIVRGFGGKKTIDVKTYTVDKIVLTEDLQSLDFIKLDIEGAELLALKGAIESIKKFKPKICLECEKDRFEEITLFLINFGYKPFYFDNHGNFIEIKSSIMPDNQNQIFYIP